MAWTGYRIDGRVEREVEVKIWQIGAVIAIAATAALVWSRYRSTVSAFGKDLHTAQAESEMARSQTHTERSSLKPARGDQAVLRSPTVTSEPPIDRSRIRVYGASPEQLDSSVEAWSTFDLLVADRTAMTVVQKALGPGSEASAKYRQCNAAFATRVRERGEQFTTKAEWKIRITAVVQHAEGEIVDARIDMRTWPANLDLDMANCYRNAVEHVKLTSERDFIYDIDFPFCLYPPEPPTPHSSE